jgi:hypothetical protein
MFGMLINRRVNHLLGRKRENVIKQLEMVGERVIKTSSGVCFGTKRRLKKNAWSLNFTIKIIPL